jgi:hypothetical protein
MTRCYFKGSSPSAHSVVGELGKDCIVTDSYCGTGSGFSKAGSFGNVVKGSFTNATRPIGSPFPAGSTFNWGGTTTTYTASPYDP